MAKLFPKKIFPAFFSKKNLDFALKCCIFALVMKEQEDIIRFQATSFHVTNDR